MDPSMLEDFGQRVDLTRRIREVLVNYPEGTTVLKELIQNADDAGATKVCLCLDRRNHGTESLMSSKLGQWQGPALLAYNDAVFTEDDFVSISRIGDSKKLSHAWKTGRFGVGFNSVYHLTDLPSFVSDKYVVLFDPQGEYLPNISAANPGKRLDYVNSSAISLYKDQLMPYCAFGCDMIKPFSGTLFRFPLRNEGQSAFSRLSRQVYLEDDILSMFSQLYEGAVLNLLFLKSILKIEMYVWEVGFIEPKRLYTCSITSGNESISSHRQALIRFSNSGGVSEPQVDSFTLDFLTESFTTSTLENKTDRFFIAQRMASPQSKIGIFAEAAAKQYDTRLLPWASVAACVNDNLPEGSVLKHGHAFCSLPLPVSTGLTVQVNGFFEIASNRRSIWYGADMERGGKLRSDWNRLLLEDVVAPAFCDLLLGLRNLLGPSGMYYSFFPAGSYDEPWNILVAKFYDLICSYPLFFSELSGGKWIPLSEAYIEDDNFYRFKELSEALILLGMGVVQLPGVLVNTMVKYLKDFHQLVNPETVRCFLKDCKTLDAASRYYKLVLLEYCFSDIDDTDVGKFANGLPLLPLANGQFASFLQATHNSCYFICDELEYKMLSVAADRIVDRNIPSGLFAKISNVAATSKANIKFIDAESFLHFFPKFFPVEWKYRDKVSWDTMVTTSPTESWFCIFWEYLRDKPYDLSLISNWPILPSTSGHLYRPSKSSKILDASVLSRSMIDILSKIGCKILDVKYGVEHRDLSLYVHDGNAAGVLNSIFETASSNTVTLHMLFEQLSSEEKNELRQFFLDPKWYIVGSLSGKDIKRCKILPIYQIYVEGNSNTHLFSDLESSKKYLRPAGIPEYLLDGDFLFCMDQRDGDVLSRYFGVETMSKAVFYKQKVLRRIEELQPEVRDSVMLSILQDLPQLSVVDSSFRESLKFLRFVPTSSGSLQSPQQLYDPRMDELVALLEDSDCFPSGHYCEPSILDMLLLLGLRTSVSVDTILQSARQIESLMHKDPLKAHSRGKVLLSYLEVNAIRWLYNEPNNVLGKVNMLVSKVGMTLRPSNRPFEADLERFWNDLRMICWCPVLVKAPHPGLPWPSISSMVAPPRIVRLQSDIWMASASTRILDGECSSSALSFSLGWSSPPGGSIIAAQLLELGKNNEIVSDQQFRQELALAMPKIYSLLTNLIGSDEMDIVKAVLEGSRWIWVGDGFATANEVVLNGNLHLAPYIRAIPVDLAVFRELFLELGVREYLKPADYADILSRMAHMKQFIPLDSHELRTSILVVQHLGEVQSRDLQVQIYLPDVTCRLVPSTDLVYNDAPWLPGFNENKFENTSTIVLNTKRDVYNFVHGNISNDLAEKLGARSLRRSLLAESSDSMNLSLSGVAEAFGQHEALTTRLKHIVEMYADGPGILFELVQNAEDAQASEVVFLLDKTNYGTSSVLSPEMAEWQGPALYCFNNSVFTSQDLYAISRIGQDSKLDKPFAIGRFGLGFNCVYHFTDIPAFVSGENIVIFDPHASYLPGISPSHPGLRIRFAGRNILEQFPDQFSPFLHFGCNLQEAFPGTLFRFPLRNEVTASRSQIKKEKYAPEDVESLFSSFAEVVSEVLLFLRNVKSVTIFVKHGAGLEMQLIQRVSRENVSVTVQEQPLIQNMLDFVKGKRQTGMDRDQFLKKLSKLDDKDLPWSCEKVSIREETLKTQFSHIWFLSECIGGGYAKRKSVASGNRHKLIPWASVAAYLHSVELKDTKKLDGTSESLNEELNFRRNFQGRAFCFLPLPVTTGLPVHVNAYFELSSNRRDIWFGNDMAGGGKARSEWNLCLLEDAIAPAFSRLVAAIAQEIGVCDLFFSLWPTAAVAEPWASTVQKYYKSVVDLGLLVLFTKARGGQWISAKQAIFPDFGFQHAIELADFLAEAGLPLVSLAKPVVDKFMECYPSLHFLNPRLLRTVLVRRKRAFKNKDAVMMALDYCLSDFDGSAFSVELFGLPLIPLANGSFAAIEKRGERERIFVTSQKEFELLRESVPHLLVDSSVPDSVVKKLYGIAHSGQSNIDILSCFSLSELLTRILPMEWQHTKLVQWTPGLDGHPSVAWMELLWNYLKVSCPDLMMFSKWPILPVANGWVLQLLNDSSVIRDEGWSENMYSLLQKLGCFLLRSDMQIDHPQLKNFVQDASAIGVLNALQVAATHLRGIDSLFENATTAEKHELRSYILQSKWFASNSMQPEHIELIKLLPIFNCYRSRELTSLSIPAKWLPPDDIDEGLLTAEFVRIASEKERAILQRFLGIKEPTKFEFYKDHVLKAMPEFLEQPMMLSKILSDVKLLIEEDASLKSALAEIPFVLAANGTWQCPFRLYDPHIPGLRNMLHNEVFFPSEKFIDNEMLQALAILGLRRTLNFTGLIDSARSVAMLHSSGNTDALNYGRRLLVYLDFLGCKLLKSETRETDVECDDTFSSYCSSYPEEPKEIVHDDESNNSHPEESRETIHGDEVNKSILNLLCNFDNDLSEDEFWSKMKTIAWCPVFVTPPIQGLPWSVFDDNMAPPYNTRPKSHMWIVSSQTRILDGKCSSKYMQQKLGWLDPPSIAVLCTQLTELSRSYNDLKITGSDPPIDAIMGENIPTIYSYLQQHVHSGNSKVIKDHLDGVPWIFIGDNFVTTRAIAFDSPVKYHPYLYVVPSELSEFRTLLSELGVKITFSAIDYVYVLQCLQRDLQQNILSAEQLTFVHLVLEAFADCYAEKQIPDALMDVLLVPDSSGVLMNAVNLFYNDAPWMKNDSNSKHLVHSIVDDRLAKKLGVKSLRSLSFVGEETVRNLVCMDYGSIGELLTLYGDGDFLGFDLLELADKCKAKKLHLIYDKREHPRRSLLQQNLGDFQGSALTAVFEGATLNTEEICTLHLPPPWKVQGASLPYGSGLISSYFICDILTILSNGSFYIFDPLGLVLPATSNGGPAAKLFSLMGTDLIDRFRDQFSPFTSVETTISSSNSLIIRMPLSSKCMKQDESDCKRVKQIFDKIICHESSTLLFLKSVLQVSLYTWEEGSSQPNLDYSVSVDAPNAILRNPFSEKKWRKFHISRLFATSGGATKMQIIDIEVTEGANIMIDKWIVVLCLGSGQTRNMALDRRYLSHNLAPVAGVAAKISRNGFPVNVRTSGCILCPLPLSGSINMPVTAMGSFLVCHDGGRYLFNQFHELNLTKQKHDDTHHLIQAWNRELMLCVRDAYVELVWGLQKLRNDPLNCAVEPSTASAVNSIMQAYGDRIYSFWPRSIQNSPFTEPDTVAHSSNSIKGIQADWQSLVEHVIRPFYVRLVDLPVWQLYGGSAVKASEGMFLSQSGSGEDVNLPPSSVCSFIKEHYPVFSVPWELVKEIKAIGIQMKEIKPKMVRDLLKSSSSVSLRSVETYIDVLEYCLIDIQLQQSSDSVRMDSAEVSNGAQFGNVNSTSNILGHPQNAESSSSSGGDALEIVTLFGKTLYDIGRGVLEDIGRGPMAQKSSNGVSGSHSDPLISSIITELKGMPFPSATSSLKRLGVLELWIGSKEQQILMRPLADNFIHPLCLEKPLLTAFLSLQKIHSFLKLKSFSAELLSSNLRSVISQQWVNHVMHISRVPWVSWNNSSNSLDDGPNPEWIRLFWKVFTTLKGELSLVNDWPFVPALLERPVLCRVKELHLVLIPPISSSLINSDSFVDNAEIESLGGSIDGIPKSELSRLFGMAFDFTNTHYPWLYSLLSQFNVPLYDSSFFDCDLPRNVFPVLGQTLGQAVLSKFVAVKKAGHFSVPANLSSVNCENLFNLFESDFRVSSGSIYGREELDVLKELPIYKTVLGTYTNLVAHDQSILPLTAFFHPSDSRCLSSSVDASNFFQALGISVLSDKEILVKFALPEFEMKTSREQEDILLYLYKNWKDLQLDSSVLSTLKETKFVRSASELSLELFKPKDLFDPHDSLLRSIFSGEQNRFPGEKFTSDGWIQILKKAGLRISSQADTIIECAKKIELLGNDALVHRYDPDDFEAIFSSNEHEVPFELWALAESLVELVFANFATLYDNTFCQLLSEIAFVPAEKGFPRIGGKKGGKRVLSSYRNSVLLKDWPLAWTSTPILIKQSIIPPEFSWGAFHLRSPPSFSTVLKHLQIVGRDNGEDTLAHWPTSSGMITVENAFLEVMKYLDKIWGTLSSSEISELQKVAFIPVANGTRLVTVKSLFVRLVVKLSPFAFELPSLYLPFVEILKEIGMQEVLTISYTRDLLATIQKSCGYQRLNPNELRAVMEALNFLCSEATQMAPDDLDWLSDVIIPDEGCRLVFARSCIYIDKEGSKFFNLIDTSRLRFAHPDIPDNILSSLGIKKLSEIVLEELDEKSDLCFLDEIAHVPLHRIKDKLVSKTLQDAIWVLLSCMSNRLPSSKPWGVLEVKDTLEQVADRLQFVKCLKTRFLLLPKLVDITRITKDSSVFGWESSGMLQSFHFLDKSLSRILIAEPPRFITVYDLVAVVVSHALGASETLPLGPLFACPDGSEKAIVKVLRLGSETELIKSEYKHDILVGKELLSQDALQVQFHPLRPFYAGEIVAWKSGKDGEKLRYGRISEDVRPSAGQALYKFPVEIGPGQVQVLLSSQIFSFKSVSMADEASTSSFSEGNTLYERGINGHISNEGNANAANQVLDDLIYGKVSANEMVQAVHDMLSAVGVNMDSEKQSLLQTTLILQEQLKESQVSLLVEQERADAAIREADAAKVAWQCRVCLSAEVNVSIVPCGHVLCQRCSAAVSRCPFCRAQVSRTMKIFRP